MKIFCVLDNYGVSAGETPGWYTLPDSTVIRTDNPFFVPDFDESFRLYPSLAVRIGKLGKSVAPRFAERYYSEATVVVIAVATGLLERRRREGKAWGEAVCFDRCCMIGDFVDAKTLLDNGTVTARCGEDELIYRTADLHHPIDDLIAMVSRDNMIKTGDIVLTGLHPTGFEARIGDTLRVDLDDEKLLEIRVK